MSEKLSVIRSGGVSSGQRNHCPFRVGTHTSPGNMHSRYVPGRFCEWGTLFRNRTLVQDPGTHYTYARFFVPMNVPDHMLSPCDGFSMISARSTIPTGASAGSRVLLLSTTASSYRMDLSFGFNRAYPGLPVTRCAEDFEPGSALILRSRAIAPARIWEHFNAVHSTM